MPPRVSIVIPAWNNLQFNRACLDSVFRHLPAEETEVVVVDNGSTDGSAQFFRAEEESGRIRLVANAQNLGFARACNQGAAASRGELLVFLNNDTEVLGRWLDALLACLEVNPVAGVVGGKLLYPDGTVQHAGVTFTRESRVCHIHKHFHKLHPAVNKAREFQAVTGACMLLPADLFHQVGGFHEEFVNGLEDLDLCMRIRQAGRKVLYTPHCEVLHHESKTPGRFERDKDNFRLFASRWPGCIRLDHEEFLVQDGLKAVDDPQMRANGFLFRDANPNPYWRQAKVCAARQEWAEAVTVYEMALSQNPHDVRNLQMFQEMAAACEQAGDVARARNAYAILAKVSPRAEWQEAVKRLERQRGGNVVAGNVRQEVPEIAAAVVREPDAPRVSIVIPAWNNLHYNRACLRALRRHPARATAEVVVVDNGSTDGSAEFFRAEEDAGRIRLVANASNLGFAKACNQGAAAARGELLLFLNNDTEVQPGWLDALVDCLDTTPDAGVVGGKLLYPDGSVQHAGVVVTKDRHIGHIYQGFGRLHPAVNKVREFQAVTGACLLLRADLFRQVGGLHEGYVNGFEDVDLCFRIRRLGFRVLYTPACEVVHHESKTAGRFDMETANSVLYRLLWGPHMRPDDAVIMSQDGLERVEEPRLLANNLYFLDSNPNPAWLAARRLAARSRYDDAVETYLEALRFNPSDARNLRMYRELTDCFAAGGDIEKAAEVRRLLAEIDPDGVWSGPAQPLMQTRGRSLATGLANPARRVTSTTSSTSL